MEALVFTALAALTAGAIWVATRPLPLPPPAGGYTIQMRPIPLSTSNMTALARQNIVAISQAQLQALGYSVPRTDGVFDPVSQAASAQFQKNNADAIQAMATQMGRTDDGVELSVLDNLYRAKYGLPTIAY